MKTLLIVDMQNDFMPGGALAVPEGDALIPVINALIPQFSLVVATQDWHPEDHASFAANHPGKHPGDIVKVKGIDQILWPVHCVRNTLGAALVAGLDKEKIDVVFYKGTDKWIDSYSAFFDNQHGMSTGLGEYLKSHSVQELTIVGVATDYCVLYSAMDAVDLGFSVTVIQSACRGINLKSTDVENSFHAMAAKGVRLL